MKNKSAEVEVRPFFNPQRDPSPFGLRKIETLSSFSPPSSPGLKNNFQKILSGLFVALVLFFPFSTSGQTIAKQEVINLTNQQRLNNNLPELKLNSQLDQAALAKAKDMLADNYFAHFSPTGEKPWDFITAAGYQYKFAGENLAMDFSSAINAVNAWMGSATHRENILSPNYDEIGLAVLEGELEGRNTILIVQMFGRRLEAPVENLVISAEPLALAPEPEPRPASPQAEAEVFVPTPVPEPRPAPPAEELPISEPERALEPKEDIYPNINPDLKINRYFSLPNLINPGEFDLFFTASGETERLALLKNKELIRLRYLKDNIFIGSTKTFLSPLIRDEFQILAFNDHSFNSAPIKIAFNPSNAAKLVKNSEVKGLSTSFSRSNSLFFLWLAIIGSPALFRRKLTALEPGKNPEKWVD